MTDSSQSNGCHPLTTWFRADPLAAQRIVDTHIRDRWGGCSACSGHHPVRYPCVLAWHAAEALRAELPAPPWPDGKYAWKSADA